MFFAKRINVQFKVYFTKDGTSNVTVQTVINFFIILDFFLLLELEIKPITVYYHTLKYHNS
jgi:hypothetical protein